MYIHSEIMNGWVPFHCEACRAIDINTVHDDVHEGVARMSKYARMPCSVELNSNS